VAAPHTILPDLDLLDQAGLKALILSQYEQLLSHQSEIEHLKLLIAKLRRMQFGRKSEKLDRQIEQLELRLEELQSSPLDNPNQAETKLASATPSLASTPQPARRALPGHLPRQTQRHEPKDATCPGCGGKLRKLGEDVSEVLEYLPASFFVVRHVRPKLSCTGCDCIVQAPAPSRPIRLRVARGGPADTSQPGAPYKSGRPTPATLNELTTSMVLKFSEQVDDVATPKLMTFCSENDQNTINFCL
jgi:hypothetical protein